MVEDNFIEKMIRKKRIQKEGYKRYLKRIEDKINLIRDLKSSDINKI